MTHDQLELLTTAQVAELLQVSKQTIWRATKEGRLRPTRLSSQVIRYSREDIDAWIEAGKRL